ncbi:hypothetical protein [Dactylosporangium sp. NPDC005555]|uniref:hypothetical protein n=1 Tax=Dactylosporangium sp. NPDC005555 TaxID=3154889 RepID=UPI0033BBEE32
METSLTAAVDALRRSGLEPVVRQAPRQWSASPVEPGAWVRMPGDEAYAVVTVADIRPGERVGDWEEVRTLPDPTAVLGFTAAFYERRPDAATLPLEHGDPVAVPSGQFHSVFPEDVVAAVEDWAQWEATWAVVPAVEPASRRRARLQRLATSKLTSGTVPVDIALDPMLLSMLSPEQAEDLDETVAGLFLPGIRWWFPRDRTGGRFAGRTQVLLRELVPPSTAAGKGIWLAVGTAAGGGLRAGLGRFAGRSAYHRWDRMPQYWQSPATTVDELWGGQGPRLQTVVDALLSGHALEALDMCGVTTDRATARVLQGLPECFRLREWTDKWTTNATALMANAAPWRWAASPPERRRPRRLETLGGFGASRRPGLFLGAPEGPAHLSFAQSGSPLVAPRVEWERDPDFDLVRLGLLTTGQIPLRRR